MNSVVLGSGKSPAALEAALGGPGAHKVMQPADQTSDARTDTTTVG